MGNLHDWMRDEARETAVKLSGINSNEVLRGAAGGFGMRQRVNALLDTVKAAMFPSLYETGAVSHTHLTALAEEHLYSASEQMLSIAMDLIDPMDDGPMKAENITLQFMKSILPIREVLTTDLEAAYAYYVTGLPVTYFIDADGNLIAHKPGALDAELLERGINMILK